MHRFLPALGSATIVVAVLVIGAVYLLPNANRPGVGGQPSPTPSPEASSSPSASPEPSSSPSEPLPPPLTERFDSTFNGISMDYPAGWQTRPATELWTDGVLSFGASGVDVIFDPTRREDLYFAVASEPLGGRPDHVWSEDLTLPKCPGGHAGSVLTFDGASGWVVECGGRAAGGHHSAFLTTDTRGYALVLYFGEEGLADTYSVTWFLSFLETLDFRAEDAPDASNPSESP